MRVTTLILGAGAAGLMCAGEAGPGTLVIDHARKPGEKIRISGGGRCNFTNLEIAPERFLSANPHFAKSALARYTQWDFIARVSDAGIAWHEKTLGQLFCDESARDMVAMLVREAEAAGATLWLETTLERVEPREGGFIAWLRRGADTVRVEAAHLVLATGGKSIPKMGATSLAYEIAAQFGHEITETRPGLVPLTFPDGRFAALAGTALPARVTADGPGFDEALLFTHRGLSGPAVLQASSYWREGTDIAVDLSPGADLAASLRAGRAAQGRRRVSTHLAQHLPQRLVDHLAAAQDLTGNLADLSDRRIDALAAALHGWRLRPSGSEGYRTAEVTLGGIATEGLSSQTLESRHHPGLFAIGEAVDVTGWLGGYNFQWAWSSGWAAGQALRARA